MAIPIKINVFEGPLDLLLHLIEKNKIDIYDIPLWRSRISTWSTFMEWKQRIWAL